MLVSRVGTPREVGKKTFNKVKNTEVKKVWETYKCDLKEYNFVTIVRQKQMHGGPTVKKSNISRRQKDSKDLSLKKEREREKEGGEREILYVQNRQLNLQINS